MHHIPASVLLQELHVTARKALNVPSLSFHQLMRQIEGNIQYSDVPSIFLFERYEITTRVGNKYLLFF